MRLLGKRHHQRQCSHINAVGIYGDSIRATGDSRGWCPDCKLFLDLLPIKLRDQVWDMDAPGKGWTKGRRVRYKQRQCEHLLARSLGPAGVLIAPYFLFVCHDCATFLKERPDRDGEDDKSIRTTSENVTP